MINNEHVTQQLEQIKTTQDHLKMWLTADRVQEITAEMMTAFQDVTNHVVKREINIISREVLGNNVMELTKQRGE
jgi:hypothetical protein|tara:strand:+ start:157 stop:381 length:225 start_codon:yes stop_codon:yes gene_type:complete